MLTISFEELAALVNYDRRTGIFTSRVDRKMLRSGDVLGSPNDGGYLRVRLNGRRFTLHRFAWFIVKGTWPLKIDHKNGNTADNRFTNLRVCNTVQNARNRKIGKTNTSGAVGVAWIQQQQAWRAYITLKGVRIVLGTFSEKEPAVLVRLVAEEFFFGRFQRKSE